MEINNKDTVTLTFHFRINTLRNECGEVKFGADQRMKRWGFIPHWVTIYDSIQEKYSSSYSTKIRWDTREELLKLLQTRCQIDVDNIAKRNFFTKKYTYKIIAVENTAITATSNQ